jgi:hypothetical protein
MSLSESRPQFPSALRTIVARWRRLRTTVRPKLLDARITYAEVPSAPADPGLVIGVIDDPETAMRLVSVRGPVTLASLDALVVAFEEERDCSRLHLDLTDAEFADRSVISSIAGLLDELDDRRVHLRIVGLGRLATLPVD